MRRYQQATALVFLAFAAFIVWEALQLQYYTPLGPGAGFFGVWLGVILGLLSLLLLVELVRPSPTTVVDPVASVEQELSSEQVLPDRYGLTRIGAVIGALILTALLLPLLGFQLTVFLLLIFLLLGLERVRPVPALIIAVVFSFGLYQLLTRYLGVELPGASLAPLARLGL